ncbi:hypothetical protein SAMN02982929_07174 [Saccharopolyspora kobensis]|uniref:Uncharacterized protein n=1 Tax=Saccharopolyspora kobensis TaxID=146035 RepID=A0A1H6ELD0_9PSEU|nr:hypothetical protein SAMN02982929_07174 [Saccharopolyspora kobensis]SFD24087.1 hypothetical protein SAMN05216506_103195 [Saccharopolyspora kobensis]
MADLDARIRARLDHGSADSVYASVDAVRAVLDKIADAEEFGDDVDLDDIQTAIARELGVETDG